MPDLVLTGLLDLSGNLTFVPTQGTVKIALGSGEKEVVVTATDMLTEPPHSKTGVPVLLPPQAPIQPGTDVWVISSFNATVRIKDKPVVAMGMTMQGGTPGIWPGMVPPSVQNQFVTIDKIPVNVQDDMAVTLPNRGNAKLSASGQLP